MDREQYSPGPARGAQVQKETPAQAQGEQPEDTGQWTLILVRELRHAPEKVWQALTEPSQLREWAPFDADASLAAAGTTVKLTTVGAPASQASEAKIARAEAPRLLEYNWGGQEIRWQLEPLGAGTRLTLWHSIDRRFISWGAAGWHICLDVLDQFLAGDPMGRIVGPDATRFGGWQRLNTEYASQFGIEAPGWTAPKS
jgi:uncharacterized protein YndB with AHSA1/START domain